MEWTKKMQRIENKIVKMYIQDADAQLGCKAEVIGLAVDFGATQAEAEMIASNLGVAE